MRAFAGKWKLSEQADVCRLATTKTPSFQTNFESFHAFFQGQKCEPSRANGNSQSKPTYVGLRPPKPHHSKQIPRVPMFFCNAKNASLREQMENPRARQHTSACHHQNTIIPNKFREFPCFFATQKMRAFASKWKLSEQADKHRLATTKTPSFQTNYESFHVFLQRKKCEPSRANGNSQSKPTNVGLRLSAHP